ncbi:MAG: XRE family transcriptional regulator [Oscillospiraceae bacterium]|nr:XRE family transcriptional regulator [Oscillospiraceae bacterium]
MATKNGRIIPMNAPVGLYDAKEERSENVIGQRIADARKRMGMTQQELVDYLPQFGVSVSKYAESKWETGDTVPSAYQLMAVCAALGMDDVLRCFSKKCVSLLNDEGERKVMEYRADLVASGKYRPIQKHKIRYVEMPVSTLAASAGTGAFLDDDNVEMVSFPENTIPNGAEFGIRVSGDSMEPVYHDGQIVWVRQCDTISIGEVGIFTLDGDGYIKCYDEQEPEAEVQEEFTDVYGELHMQPVLVSYNQNYPPRPVMPTSDFRLVGRVL